MFLKVLHTSPFPATFSGANVTFYIIFATLLNLRYSLSKQS